MRKVSRQGLTPDTTHVTNEILMNGTITCRGPHTRELRGWRRRKMKTSAKIQVSAGEPHVALPHSSGTGGRSAVCLSVCPSDWPHTWLRSRCPVPFRKIFAFAPLLGHLKRVRNLLASVGPYINSKSFCSSAWTLPDISCNSRNIYKPVEEIQLLLFFFFSFCSLLFITLNVKSPSTKHNYTDKLKELVSRSKLPSPQSPAS